MIHPCDHVQQCGFARTRFADDPNKLACIDIQINFFERVEFTCRGGIHFYNVAQFDEGWMGGDRLHNLMCHFQRKIAHLHCTKRSAVQVSSGYTLLATLATGAHHPSWSVRFAKQIGSAGVTSLLHTKTVAGATVQQTCRCFILLPSLICDKFPNFTFM